MAKFEHRTRKSLNPSVPVSTRHCYEAPGDVGDDGAIFSLNRGARAINRPVVLPCNQFLFETVYATGPRRRKAWRTFCQTEML
ncbi:protein of unknown function [Aminobacter niigataensis]|nr:protein of unknown function [Aminobacter niigataensis]